MTGPITWRSRGIGLDVTPGCFVCGGAEAMRSNIAAILAKDDEEAALACFERGARMAYFHGDRKVPQIKVGACDTHLPALEHLARQWYISAEHVAQLVAIEEMKAPKPRLVCQDCGFRPGDGPYIPCFEHGGEHDLQEEKTK